LKEQSTDNEIKEDNDQIEALLHKLDGLGRARFNVPLDTFVGHFGDGTSQTGLGQRFS